MCNLVCSMLFGIDNNNLICMLSFFSFNAVNKYLQLLFTLYLLFIGCADVVIGIRYK